MIRAVISILVCPSLEPEPFQCPQDNLTPTFAPANGLTWKNAEELMNREIKGSREDISVEVVKEKARH